MTRLLPSALSWVKPPTAPRGDQSDTFWDMHVPDPYRWMETPSPDLDRWRAEQAQIINQLCAELPAYDGALTFLRDHEPRTAARSEAFVSPDGRTSVQTTYQRAASGVRLSLTLDGQPIDRDIESDFPLIKVVWSADSSAFVYNAIYRSARPSGIYLHRIGTPDDVLLVAQPNETGRFVFPYPADDGLHFLIHFEHFAGATGGWALRGFAPDAPLTPLLPVDIPYRMIWVGSRGSWVYFVTDNTAPNWRIVALDLNAPETQREIVPQQTEPIAMYAGANDGKIAVIGDQLLVTYVRYNTHVIRAFDLNGVPLGEVALPTPCQVNRIGADAPGTAVISVESFVTPPADLVYDLTACELIRSEVSTVDDVRYKLSFYTSNDGTRIPLTLVYRRGTLQDGDKRILLAGYGGWGVAFMPKYDPLIQLWLDWGGVYAIAHVRGGSEYGEAWHQAGQRANKQNSFDDFCAAAEHLIHEGWTQRGRIAITGATGGGLLVTVCAQQRPDLFAAAVAEAAPVDLLRFPDTPFGELVSAELGHPRELQAAFAALFAYSPLHTIPSGACPPLLHLIGAGEERFQPGQLYKHVAAMQHAGHVTLLGELSGRQRAALKAAFCRALTDGAIEDESNNGSSE